MQTVSIKLYCSIEHEALKVVKKKMHHFISPVFFGFTAWRLL
jgi:hypothetical protein